MGAAYHFLYLCLDVAQRPFKVGHFYGIRVLSILSWDADLSRLSHRRRDVDKEHRDRILGGQMSDFATHDRA